MRGSTTRRSRRCRSSCRRSVPQPPRSRRAAATGCGRPDRRARRSRTGRTAGGNGPVYSQLTFCWAAIATRRSTKAHRIWRNSVVPGQLSQDLPTPTHFEQAASIVTQEMVAESMVCGPDADALIKQANDLIDAGVDHLYFHQIGADQSGVLRGVEAARSNRRCATVLTPAFDSSTSRESMGTRLSRRHEGSAPE